MVAYSYDLLSVRLTSGALWDGIVVISHHDHIWIGGLNGLLREVAEVEEGESEEAIAAAAVAAVNL